MPKKLLLPSDIVDASVLSGTSTALVIAAGVAIVVGWSYKRAVFPTNNTKGVGIRVGLLRIYVPQNFRDLVKNDVLIEQASQSVSKTLYIFVLGKTKREVINYISELYTMAWDVACALDKPFLDIRIVGNQGTKTWEDILLRPELNAVFGEDAMVDMQQLPAQRFAHDELLAVTYHSLAIHVERRLAREINYFEDEHTTLSLHKLVLLGGTFDHLHTGHKKLLSLAVSICAHRLLVGITADSMLTNKSHAELLEPMETRARAVREYLFFLNPHIVAEIVPISDPYGPAIVIPESAAMVVSTETLAGAAKINRIRREHKLPKLIIFACRRSNSSTLSSSCIRAKIAMSRLD
ncbi:hypothetical protein CCR75_004397 [Bremia lactucae]|uniref:Cytidyltransferase-like domain-containing protein n=1 Tax=Bremia lactucae TaxID=4779 RepID=A0A976FMD4_BRELC|nr:hypothetical protein CCR75_004397 [Bremia lactucae]